MNKIIDVISLFAPFILISIFVFMSIFNQDLKAMFLLAGIFFMLYILKQVSSSSANNDDNQFIIYCSMFNTLETPGTSTAIISFIFMYMLLPMIYNNQYNLLMLISLSLIWILDIYHKLFQYKCFEKSLGLIATLIGLAAGSGFFFTIYNLGEEYYNFLYFNVSKNNLVQCSKNDDTEYQCSFEEEDGTTGTTHVTTAGENNFNTGSSVHQETANTGSTSALIPSSRLGAIASSAAYRHHITRLNEELRNINSQFYNLINADNDGVHLDSDQDET